VQNGERFCEKVDDVLLRYSAKFQASLTAVVNYFQMPAYPFQVNWVGSRRLILASGIAPGAVTKRRLDLHLEEALLERGFSTLLRTEVKSAGIAPERRSADRGEADRDRQCTGPVLV
jgi:hypothetical protein